MSGKVPEQSRFYRALVVIGGFALLAATAIDVVAVLGRMTRVPLLGSIELVQVVVGVSGVLARLVATLHKRHARVLIIYNRLGTRGVAVVSRFNACCGVLFYLGLLAGSMWLLADFWSSFEESELWRIPYRPLRIVICVVLAATSSVFLWQAWRGDKS